MVFITILEHQITPYQKCLLLHSSLSNLCFKDLKKLFRLVAPSVLQEVFWECGVQDSQLV